MEKRIYCEARQLPEEEFDKIPIEELKNMVGWVEPDGNDKWDVMMCDGNGFECDNQATAQFISGNEEIKALLMKYNKTTTTTST